MMDGVKAMVGRMTLEPQQKHQANRQEVVAEVTKPAESAMKRVTLPGIVQTQGVEVAAEEPAGNAMKRDILQKIVLKVVEEAVETAVVATAERKATWPPTVPSPRCVEGAARKDTRWTSAPSLLSVAIAGKRVT